MVFHVLTDNRNVMTRSKVVHLSQIELRPELNKIRMAGFIKSKESTLDNYSHTTFKLIDYKHDDPYK